MNLKQAKNLYLGLVMVSSGYFTYRVLDRKADFMFDEMDELNAANAIRAFTIGAGEAGISMAVGIVTGAIVNTIL